MSQRETLRTLIAQVRERTRALHLSYFKPKFEDLIRVSSELLRASLEHAEAILTLLDHDQVEATAALERAAWEIWKESDFLTTRDNADEDASRSRIHAALEVQEAATKAKDVPSEMLTKVDDVLAGYMTTHGAIVEEMRTLRKEKGKHLHWSGKSRTSVYASDEANKLVYKLLSWEAHPIAIGLRDVEIDGSGASATVSFKPTENAEVLGERVAWAVGHSLLFVWNNYAAVWGFEAIPSPWPH